MDTFHLFPNSLHYQLMLLNFCLLPKHWRLNCYLVHQSAVTHAQCCVLNRKKSWGKSTFKLFCDLGLLRSFELWSSTVFELADDVFPHFVDHLNNSTILNFEKNYIHLTSDFISPYPAVRRSGIFSCRIFQEYLFINIIRPSFFILS